MKLLISVLGMLMLLGCSSAERTGPPTYGAYTLKIQIFHRDLGYTGESIECVDIVNGGRVSLVYVDRTDIGGRKFYEGLLDVTASSDVNCYSSSEILFNVEEQANRKVVVWAFVPFDSHSFGQNYFFSVTPSFYAENEYAPTYQAQ